MKTIKIIREELKIKNYLLNGVKPTTKQKKQAFRPDISYLVYSEIY
ncbi:hypothetical protein [Emticicia sp. C21]|nr:hypothetical protein [Emticicia sp. C21]